MYPQAPLQLHIRKQPSYTFLVWFYSRCNFSLQEAVDSGKEVRVVFCDISKAFDRVWHRGLLHKLAGMGLSEGRLRRFKSYLSHRRQRVVLNGVESNWADVLSGVPH